MLWAPRVSSNENSLAGNQWNLSPYKRLLIELTLPDTESSLRTLVPRYRWYCCSSLKKKFKLLLEGAAMSASIDQYRPSTSFRCGRQEHHSSGAEAATVQAAAEQHSGSRSHDEGSDCNGTAGTARTAGTAGTPGAAGAAGIGPAGRSSSGNGSRLKDPSQLQLVVVTERLAGLQQRQQQLEVDHSGYVPLECLHKQLDTQPTET